MAGLLAAFVGGTAPQIAGTSYVGSLQSLELAMTYVAGGLAGAAVGSPAEPPYPLRHGGVWRSPSRPAR